MDKDEARRIIGVLEEKASKTFLTPDEIFQQKEALRYLSEVEREPRAMAYLGGMYYGEENYPLAEKYYLEAYNEGYKEIASGLGFIYFYGRVGKPDYQKAMKYFLEAANMGDLESEMKIADMYRKGMGMEPNYEEYAKRIASLWQRIKNEDDFFTPLPEVAHRMADIDIKEGKIDKAKTELRRGRLFIVYRIKYNSFWGNFIVLRRIEELMNQLGMIDKEEPNFFDLFVLLKEPSKYILTYAGKTFEISSFFDEGKIRVSFLGKDYASIEDFLRKAEINGTPVCFLEAMNNYFLVRAKDE